MDICKQDCLAKGGECRAVVREKGEKRCNKSGNKCAKDDNCNQMTSLDYENGKVQLSPLRITSGCCGDYDFTVKNCDECAANPCQHEGTCVYGEYFNSYKCNCPTEAEGSTCENCVAGFTSNGARCDANACHPTEIPHSKNKAVNDSVTGVTGEEVDIVCDDGFTSSITSSKIQCQSNGDFTSMSCDPGKDPPQPLAF